MRRGFTLAELIASLVVLSAVLGLATHAIVGQLRFLGGVSSVATVRAALSQTDGVVQSLLWAASPLDITVALDSALELRVPIGTAVVCSGAIGTLAIASPTSPSGNALSAFSSPPDIGDRVAVLFSDSTGTSWLTFDVAAPPSAGGDCPRVGAPESWRIAVQQQADFADARAVQVLRPVRLSLYRSSDGLWYMGARDWNGLLGRFNSIQPVSGPLRPYSSSAAATGLAFVYRDSTGAPLSSTADPGQIATVVVLARADTRTPVRTPGIAAGVGGVVRDSLVMSVTLRNRP